MKNERFLVNVLSGLLLLFLTLGGVSTESASDHVKQKNSYHNKTPPENNLYEDLLQIKLQAQPLDSSENVQANTKLTEGKSKQLKPQYDGDDLYHIFQEKDLTQQNAAATSMISQKVYSSEKKSTKSELSEQEVERRNDFKLYFVLLIPWLIFPISKASYFTILELFNAYGDKNGVPDESAFLFQVIAQCVDFVALTRGRFKFIDGGIQNMEQEMLDYFLTKLGAPDYQKVVVQLMLPVNDWPEYEEKKK